VLRIVELRVASCGLNPVSTSDLAIEIRDLFSDLLMKIVDLIRYVVVKSSNLFDIARLSERFDTIY